MTHRIAIVAHLDRYAQAERLAQSTTATYIHYDDGTIGCNQSHLNTWAWHRDHTTTEWSVVLEDDAIPVDGFTNQLDAALTTAPTPIVSLYLGRQRPPQWQQRITATVEQAQRDDACWIIGSHLLHAVGVAIRTELLPAMLNHAGHALPADERISAWAKHHGHHISYTWPSLVDHADQPSLVAHRDGKPRPPGRIAWATGTRDQWNHKSVNIVAASTGRSPSCPTPSHPSNAQPPATSPSPGSSQPWPAKAATPQPATATAASSAEANPHAGSAASPSTTKPTT